MIVWLEKALVPAIHDRHLAEHGGSAGGRDETLLEPALVRPQQLFAYGDPAPDLAKLAASLAFGLARNHPFVDGNKRTAYIAYRTFPALNNTELVTGDEEKDLTILALAEGKLSEKAFAAWLRAYAQSSTQNQSHEWRDSYQVKSSAKQSTRRKSRQER